MVKLFATMLKSDSAHSPSPWLLPRQTISSVTVAPAPVFLSSVYTRNVFAAVCNGHTTPTFIFHEPQRSVRSALSGFKCYAQHILYILVPLAGTPYLCYMSQYAIMMGWDQYWQCKLVSGAFLC